MGEYKKEKKAHTKTAPVYVVKNDFRLNYYCCAVVTYKCLPKIHLKTQWHHAATAAAAAADDRNMAWHRAKTSPLYNNELPGGFKDSKLVVVASKCQLILTLLLWYLNIYCLNFQRM